MPLFVLRTGGTPVPLLRPYHCYLARVGVGRTLAACPTNHTTLTLDPPAPAP